MKKGCFYTGITIFTILVAVVIYIYKNNKSFFSDFARDRIVNESIKELTIKIDTTIHSNYADSLKILLKEYKSNRKIQKMEDALEDLGQLTSKLRSAIKDKRIDTIKYIELKNFVKDYERSKKN